MEHRLQIGTYELTLDGKLGLNQWHDIVRDYFTDTMKGVLYLRILMRAARNRREKRWEMIWVPEWLHPYGIELHKNFDCHFEFYLERRKAVKSCLFATELPIEIQNIIYEYYNDESRWVVKTQKMQLKSAMRRAHAFMRKVARNSDNFMNVVTADMEIESLHKITEFPWFWGDSLFVML